MPEYNVKAWISVQADNEREAEEKANRLLENLPSDLYAHVSIEGEGSTYTDDYDIDDSLPRSPIEQVGG